MTSKILVDAEVSMTQEDFLLFKEAAERVELSIGDFIISSTRHEAIRVLEFDTSTRENPSDTRPLIGINQEDECQQTSENRTI